MTALEKQLRVKFFDLNPEFEDRQLGHNTEECSFFYFFPNPSVEKSREKCQHCFSCSKLGQDIENHRDPDAPIEEN